MPLLLYILFTHQNIKLEEVTIYNALGQLIKNIASNPTHRLEISDLTEEGIYWIKVQTDEGTLTKRVIRLNEK